MAHCALESEPRSVPLGGASLDDVMALAEPYALAPRVASRLARAGLSPSETERLDGLAAEFSARTAILLHDAATVSSTLSAAEIPCILLKGSAIFAQGLAAELGERHTDDVDILVDEADAETVAQTLLAGGYRRAASMDRICYDGSTREELRPPGEHSLVTLVSPLGTEIDVHFAVPDSRVSTFAAVDAHCRTVDLNGVPVRVPVPGLLLAHLCEHVTWHHAMLPRYVPRHLADVVSIVAGAGVEVWAEAQQVADPASVRLTRGLIAAVRRSSVAARAVLPGPASARARETVIESARMAGRIAYDAVHDRGRLLKKVLPARSFIAATYGVEEDDPRLPLYYVHRLATLRWLLRPYRG